MTFRQMELFVAVCEHKKISRASEIYHISQQGISKMVRELEQELDCSLLIRTKSGVTPTEVGAFFLGECLAILRQKNLLVSNIAKRKGIPHEWIHVGMAYGVIAALPHKLMHTFEQENPFVKLAYSDHTDFQLESMLQNGDYDFCVTTGVLDSDRFMSELLFSEPLYLCIPQTHELFHKKKIQMSDLVTQSFAMFSTQFHIRHKFVETCTRAGFEPIIEISSSDFNSLKEIAIQNDLLFVVPEHTLSCGEEKFRYYKFPEKQYRWNVYFTKKKAKVMTGNMTAFYEHLKSAIGLNQKRSKDSRPACP